MRHSSAALVAMKKHRFSLTKRKLLSNRKKNGKFLTLTAYLIFSFYASYFLYTTSKIKFAL